MADFIVNSTSDKAVRKSQVAMAEIQQIDSAWALLVKVTERPIDVVFETDATEAGIATKAANFFAALEGE